MSILIKKLNGKAISHLKNVLEFDNYLSQCIKKYIELLDGELEAFAYMPEHFDVSTVNDFKFGGVFSRSPTYMGDYLMDKLNQHQNSFIIFDDVMASPSDANIHTEDTIFFYNNEIYHYIDGSSSAELISKIVWATSVSWHFLCVVLEPGGKLTKEEVSKNFSCDLILNYMKEIIVGAFDGEGFIHYIKQSNG